MWSVSTFMIYGPLLIVTVFIKTTNTVRLVHVRQDKVLRLLRITLVPRKLGSVIVVGL